MTLPIVREEKAYGDLPSESPEARIAAALDELQDTKAGPGCTVATAMARGAYVYVAVRVDHRRVGPVGILQCVSDALVPIAKHLGSAPRRST